MIKTIGDYHSGNILVAEDLKEVISKLKNEGKMVGLCVGAFDLMHSGHINHLISAKKHCDVLVVGVTSDSFVSKRKANRPIFSQQLRAFSISQIKPVDFIFISDYKTANEAILLLEPDYYIKGPDYKTDVVSDILSERESIEKVGGKIIYTEDEKLSTSEIIGYIKKYF